MSSGQYAMALEPFTGTFSAEALIGAAESATGLADWGGRRWDEDRFRHDLSVLCASAEETAQLSEEGRSRLHSRLMTMLVSRLRYLDARKGAAGVDAQVIERPLIGTGMGRAGTTFLHGLLAADPANRVARAYEAAMPAPVLEGERDIRPELYQAILDFQGQTQQHVRDIHPFGAELPEECIFLQEGACNNLYGVYCNVPAYQQAVAGKVPLVYAWQKGVMQYLQAKAPQRRWLLKAPGHMFTWAEMMMAFPDAQIYVNHRDPGKIVPSMASLFMALRQLHSDTTGDPRAMGQQQLAMWSGAMNAYAAWRAGPGRDAAVFDVDYAKLIADPLGVAGELYERFGLAMTNAAREAMMRHLEVDHHGKSPKRRYTLEEFGLTERDVEEAFAPYFETFEVTREKRG